MSRFRAGWTSLCAPPPRGGGGEGIPKNGCAVPPEAPPEARKAMQGAVHPRRLPRRRRRRGRETQPGKEPLHRRPRPGPRPLCPAVHPIARRRSQSTRKPRPYHNSSPRKALACYRPLPCRPTPAVEQPEAKHEQLPPPERRTSFQGRGGAAAILALRKRGCPGAPPSPSPGMPATRKRRPPALDCRLAGGRPGPKPSSSSSSSGGSGDGSGSFCPPEGRPAPAPPRLGPGYFDQPCIRLAKALLGQVLVRRLPGGEELRARIVETEAYLGGEDSASHSRGGHQTRRNTAMFMPPGTLYVYQIYGIYFCMNISSQGEGAAVLLRSLEPLQGQEAMRRLRLAQRKGPTGILKDWQLCNGPSKLCQALGVDKTFDQQDLPSHPFLWLEAGKEALCEEALVSTMRVGISGDWAHKPLRFYIRGNRCVSIVDRKAEQGSQPPS